MNLISSTPEQHDELGPSIHPMLCLCPSFRQSFSTNNDTIRGTFCHNLANNLFNKQLSEADVMTTDFSFIYPLEFKDADREYVINAVEQANQTIQWFKHQTGSAGIMVMAEKWLPLENLDISGGTIDITVIGDFHHTMAIDFKFGRMYVSPQSPQLMSIQSKLVRQYPGGRIFNAIIQPALRNEPLIHEVLLRQITDHEKTMNCIIQAARSPDSPRIANKYCDWCDKFGTCASAHAGLLLAKSSLPDLEQLPSELLADYYEKAVLLKKYAGKLEEELIRRVLSGIEITDRNGDIYFMSEGRKKRKWRKDEETVSMVLRQCIREKNRNRKEGDRQILEDEIFTRKLKGIGAMETLVGKSKSMSALMNTATEPSFDKGTLQTMKRIN